MILRLFNRSVLLGCAVCAPWSAFAQWSYQTQRLGVGSEARADDRAGRAVALDGDNLVIGVPAPILTSISVLAREPAP